MHLHQHKLEMLYCSAPKSYVKMNNRALGFKPVVGTG